MKAILIITILSLLTLTSFGISIYEPGAVKAHACGKNDLASTSYSKQFGYVAKVCHVTVEGQSYPGNLYSFDIVSINGEKNTYVYSQVSSKAIPSYPNLVTADLQIVGGVINKKFNVIYFFSKPEPVPMVIASDKYSPVTSLYGNLRVIGDSVIYPVQVSTFETIYYIQ